MPVRRIRKAWFVDFRFGGERCRRRAPHNSKSGALAYELFLKKECGIYGSISAALRAHTPKNQIPCPTLSEFAPRWFSGYVVVNNRITEQKLKRAIFEQHILPVFGALRMCDIGNEEIERYKGLKRDRLSAKTINNHLAVLHRCLVCAKEWNVLNTEVPHIPLMKYTEPAFRFLTTDECNRLLAAAPEGIQRTMILMGLHTGLRFSELSALRWEHVDIDRLMVTVCHSAVDGYVGPPKNSRIRHIPLTHEIATAVDKLPRACPYIFHADGRLMWYQFGWRLINKASQNSGIEPASWHDLRHTFASTLVDRGASLLAVQKLLGHSHIDVTMRYSHLGRESLRTTVSLLENQFLRDDQRCYPTVMQA